MAVTKNERRTTASPDLSAPSGARVERGREAALQSHRLIRPVRPAARQAHSEERPDWNANP